MCGVAMAGERWRESDGGRAAWRWRRDDGRMKALVVARGLAAEARELAENGQKRRFPARGQG